MHVGVTYVHDLAQQEVTVVGEHSRARVVEPVGLGSGLLLLYGPAGVCYTRLVKALRQTWTEIKQRS